MSPGLRLLSTHPRRDGSRRRLTDARDKEWQGVRNSGFIKGLLKILGSTDSPPGFQSILQE